MRFDIYGRYQLDVVREDGRWVVYRVGAGTRAPVDDLLVPPDVAPDELVTYLKDLLHELAEPGRTIRRIGSPGVPGQRGGGGALGGGG